MKISLLFEESQAKRPTILLLIHERLISFLDNILRNGSSSSVVVKYTSLMTYTTPQCQFFVTVS
jgi:hypothetical protein